MNKYAQFYIEELNKIAINTDNDSLLQAAKEFGVQGALATGVSATLLGAGGLALRKKAPAFGKMLTGAAWSGVHFLNPVYSYQTIKKIPEASKLFAEQMRLSNILIDSDIDRSGGLAGAQRAYAASGLGPNDEKAMQEIKAYKKKYKETPADSIEASLGVLSGFTGLGGAGVAAMNPIFEEKTKIQKIEKKMDIVKKAIKDLLKYK